NPVLGAGLVLLLGVLPVRGVIFYATGDPNYNTSAPTGALTNSGWQFEGAWGGFLGTAIGPKHFITPSHIPINVANPFLLNGTPFPTTAVYDDPDSDLRIWRVCGTLPLFAPLYPTTNETGKGLIVIGRGTQRGAAVTTPALPFGAKTNGWLWGLQDGIVRW